jgi:hypothetical protein
MIPTSASISLLDSSTARQVAPGRPDEDQKSDYRAWTDWNWICGPADADGMPELISYRYLYRCSLADRTREQQAWTG